MLYGLAQFPIVKISWQRFPLDIVVVLIWVVLTLPVVLFDLPGRAVLGLPLLLFIPGYTLVFALFPGQDLSMVERLALSMGLSIAIVPLIGLGLNYTPWGIRLDPLLAALTAFVGGTAAVGWHRWQSLPPEHRLTWSITLSWPRAESNLDMALNVGLIISIIVAMCLLVYLVMTPQTGERFTEFYLLGPDGVAADYPTNLDAGEQGEVIMGIANHEGKTVNYTVEVWGINYSYGLLFDGIDDYVTVCSHPDLNVSTGISIIAEVNATDGQPWNLLGKPGSYILEVNRQGVRFGIHDPDAIRANSDGYVVVTHEGNVPKWSRIACTYGSSSRMLRVFVNRTEVANLSTAGGDGLVSSSTSPLYIGKVWDNHFQGVIRQMSLYQRELSPQEIENGRAVHGMVGQWRFDAGYGNQVEDVTGNISGNITGATWINTGRVTTMRFLYALKVSLNHTRVDVEGDWTAQWEYRYCFSLDTPGLYKISFLLFMDDTLDDAPEYISGNDYPDEADRPGAAYRETHLWVTVH
ncbi:MAG: DUF1616 domain-containing protein [Thermoplasmatota archaeon]